MSLPPHFWAKTLIEDTGYATPCLTWTVHKMPNGYGRFSVNRTPQYAHRVAYEALVEPTPEGLVIDHLCRNRACVNVAHMEAVTNRINILRGQTVTGANAAKTHCKHGHPFSPENTRLTSNGRRACRTCHRIWREQRTAREHAERAQS
ncbi:HNH endonuclease signature motif containing protein [Streptomyces chilikensis]|uniref:HNH endonuclease signature motif containing protein n=1 Tax=Streptomyces chilikensis TaxID=1194079 RepID=A0ABV3EJB3_9ACTN